MSLLNLIVEHKTILITLLLAIAPLVIAVTILLVTRIRQQRAEHRETRQRRALRRQAMQEIEVRNRQAVSPLPVADGEVAIDLLNEDQSILEEDQEEEETGSDESAEDGPTDQIQSLLADVFSDDEEKTNYDVLLAGVPTVDIQNLLALTESVASRLNDRTQTASH